MNNHSFAELRRTHVPRNPLIHSSGDEFVRILPIETAPTTVLFDNENKAYFYYFVPIFEHIDDGDKDRDQKKSFECAVIASEQRVIEQGYGGYLD